jgi:hypothetical protein
MIMIDGTLGCILLNYDITQKRRIYNINAILISKGEHEQRRFLEDNPPPVDMRHSISTHKVDSQYSHVAFKGTGCNL